MIAANQKIDLIATLCVLMALCILSCLSVSLLNSKLKRSDLFVEEI
jgi:hypothetical protein